MTAVSEPRTAGALAARRRSTEAAIQRVHDALQRLRREKVRVSVAAVARRADVSRTFLYDNPEARTAIAAAMTQAGQTRTSMLANQDEQHEATWRERALNAEEALKSAHAEIQSQRRRIGELLGQIRDLLWPGAVDADVSGVVDADVGGNERPRGMVPAGPSSAWCGGWSAWCR